MADYPGSTYDFTVNEQYRNMKDVLDRHPEIVDYAVEAVRRAGMEPVLRQHSRRHGRLAPLLSWACPAPTSSPAAMPITRHSNG